MSEEEDFTIIKMTFSQDKPDLSRGFQLLDKYKERSISLPKLLT